MGYIPNKSNRSKRKDSINMEHLPFNSCLSNKNFAILLLLKYLICRRRFTCIFFFGFSLSFSQQVETTITKSKKYHEEQGVHYDMDDKNDNKCNNNCINELHNIEPEAEYNVHLRYHQNNIKKKMK